MASPRKRQKKTSQTEDGQTTSTPTSSPEGNRSLRPTSPTREENQSSPTNASYMHALRSPEYQFSAQRPGISKRLFDEPFLSPMSSNSASVDSPCPSLSSSSSVSSAQVEQLEALTREATPQDTPVRMYPLPDSVSGVCATQSPNQTASWQFGLGTLRRTAGVSSIPDQLRTRQPAINLSSVTDQTQSVAQSPDQAICSPFRIGTLQQAEGLSYIPDQLGTAPRATSLPSVADQTYCVAQISDQAISSRSRSSHTVASSATSSCAASSSVVPLRDDLHLQHVLPSSNMLAQSQARSQETTNRLAEEASQENAGAETEGGET